MPLKGLISGVLPVCRAALFNVIPCSAIDPSRIAIHVVHNRHAKEQQTDWEKTIYKTKTITIFK